MRPAMSHLMKLITHSRCAGKLRGAPVASTSQGQGTYAAYELREVIRVSGQLETIAHPRSPSPEPFSSPAQVTSLHTAPARAESQHDTSQHTQHDSVTRSNSPALPSAAPVAAPLPAEDLEKLVDLIESSRSVVVITGAGCSTEAGIPDYRGPQGAYTRHGFKPMTHQQFMAGPAQRARYFARSFFGWYEFASSRPCGAHEGLARLVNNGWVSHIITQNVDRLHQKAGTPHEKVLELHGTTHDVHCLDCGHMTRRQDLQHKLAHLNPAAAKLASELAQQARDRAQQQRQQQEQQANERRMDRLQDGSAEEVQDAAQQGVASAVSRARPSTQPTTPSPTQHLVPVMRPDGDVELQDAGHGFKIPSCEQCGTGTLKPHVVFFGDNIPKPRTEKSLELAGNADLILVVGSSLMVYSAYRLVERCKKHGGKVALVNIGPTRADPLADLNLQALTGETMMRLATHPRMLLPRMM